MYNKYALSELFLNRITNGREVDLTLQQNPDSLEQMLKDDPIVSMDVYVRRLGDKGYTHIQHVPVDALS